MTLLFALLACRPDPGAPDYPEREPWSPGDDDDFYADPYETGEERLGIGVFCETDTTESVPIDDVDAHFYIYSATLTVTATDDRWEGYVADELVDNGVGWWGGGVHWDTARDLSEWDTLHLAVRGEDVADFDVGLTGGGEEVRVSAASVGYTPDDEWHELEIALSTFEAGGADLGAVTVALMLLGEGGEAGDALTVDGVYFRRGLP